ncbi:MAG: ArsI/CadI family heavy metal resistance metalloenzyme [Thermoanaerobaculia bacterium]
MTFPNVTALKPHVSINVRDVDASIAFYTRMLGAEPVKVRPGYAKFDIANPPLNFALNQVADLDSAGALSHLGIQVASTEDVVAVRDRWIEAGLLTRDERGTDCCWARQDKTWVQDPDGNEWEVFVVLEDGLTESTASSASSSCCVKTA